MNGKGAFSLMRTGTNRNKGFTAVEIAMVATVIAILALLILPIFRQRAEEARSVAAQDELVSIAKATLLVEADMPGGNFLPQLSDFDNRSNKELVAADSVAADLEPPRVRWIRPDGQPGRFEEMTEGDWEAMVIQNWEGPYLAFRNTVSLQEIAIRFPNFTSNQQGPILIPPSYTAEELAADKYPVDPWGSPYLLFGAEETVYNVRAVFSLGPDGRPSSPDLVPAIQPSHYNRRDGVLGTGDDLDFLF